MWDKLREVGTVIEIPGSCLCLITEYNGESKEHINLQCLYISYTTHEGVQSSAWNIPKRTDTDISNWVVRSITDWQLTVMKG